MTLHYPDIFEQFKCTCGECRDNCCRIGWDIEIDGKTLDFYKRQNDELSKKLIENICTEDGVNYMSHEGGCPFLDENGLCSVQLKYGEEHISDICREHPRFYEWFGDYKEAGVGLSCEETARLFTVHEKPILFTEKEIDEETDDYEFDEEMLGAFKKVRDTAVDIMQDRGFGILHRLGILLCCAEDIQQAVSDENYARLRQISGMLRIDGFRMEIVAECEDEEHCGEKEAYRELIRILGRMDYMGGELKGLFDIDDGLLDKIIADELRFDRAFGDDRFELEHVGVYFLYRYLIKAVRDGAVTERIYCAIVCTLAVRLLFMREYAENGNMPGRERRAFLMKEFSKEIEYDSDNMDIIYEEIQEGSLTYDTLGGLLFGEE